MTLLSIKHKGTAESLKAKCSCGWIGEGKYHYEVRSKLLNHYGILLRNDLMEAIEHVEADGERIDFEVSGGIGEIHGGPRNGSDGA